MGESKMRHPFSARLSAALTAVLSFSLAASLIGCESGSGLDLAGMQLPLKVVSPAHLETSSTAVAATSTDGAASLDDDQTDLPGVFEGKLKDGETLSHILTQHALPEGTAREVIRALGTRLDVRRLKPGNSWRLELSEQGDLLSFQYALSREKRYRVEPAEGGFKASEEEVDVDHRSVLVSGTVKTTLVDALLSQGQTYAFTMALVEAFQWDINFYTDVQAGDTFEALVEQVYVDGSPERVEKVLVARYQGSGVGKKEAFWFNGDYFDGSGRYLQRSFLTTPLSVLRITSHFGQRFHPILRRARAHKGIDYGATTGTPVWSVAEGTVLSAGNRGDGYGKQVMIQHAGGYVSRYAHLSRVSLAVGQRVKQKMRVGAVGSTGLSTGPHLHFEMMLNGTQINPARLKMLPTVVRTVKDMNTFQKEKTLRLAQLQEAVAALPTGSTVAVKD